MRLDISMEELFPAPIERVWQALSQPRMIARWLMPADEFDARVGARFTFRREPAGDCGGDVHCEVLEVVPPTRMVWSWQGPEDPAVTRVVFELETAGEGTRLRLRHTGDTEEVTARRITGGWTDKLGALSELLRTKEAGVD